MRSSRRAFLRSGVLGGTGLVAGCAEDPSRVSMPRSLVAAAPGDTAASPEALSGPPNIVLIQTDQQRGDCLGAAGHPVVLTPNTNRLAAEGVLFSRCYTSAPQCKPARYSFQTGRYVHQHRIWSGDVAAAGPLHYDSHVRSIRDLAGYYTAVVGKTHLTPGDDHVETYLNQLIAWGFDEAHEVYGPGQSATVGSWYTDWLTTSTPAGERDKYERYRDYVRKWTNSSPGPDVAPWYLTAEDHLDKYVAREAVAWIDGYRGDRPFYLQVNFGGPHSPFDATAEFRGIYDPDDPDLPDGILTAPGEPRSPLLRRLLAIDGAKVPADEAQLHQVQCAYYAKITLVDQCIGEVLRALELQGLLDNTWIVLTSDHGELLGDHALMGKMAFFEAAVHVPLVIRPPAGLEAGWTCRGLAEHVDVVASILDMAGLPTAPDQPGASLVPKVAGGEVADDAHQGRINVLSQNERNSMIRTDTHKLVWDHDACRIVEFYDLDDDPTEVVNRVADPAYDAQQRDLEDQLAERLAPDLELRRGCPA